jgi:hypothetical protein
MSRLSKQLKNKFCHGSQSNTSFLGGVGVGVGWEGRISIIKHDKSKGRRHF